MAAGEMTGVPALERTAPDLPMRRGNVVRREFEYVRHDTQTLIAAFNVATGRVIGVVGDTRTEQDYASFLERLFTTAASTTGWRVVATISTRISRRAWSACSPDRRHRHPRRRRHRRFRPFRRHRHGRLR